MGRFILSSPEGYGQPEEKRTDYDLFNRDANGRK